MEINKPATKTHQLHSTTVDLSDTMYTKQTGAFPHLSRKGNRYIIVALHVDANYIALEAIKTRAEEQIISGLEKIISKYVF